MTDGASHNLTPGARVEVRNRFDGSWSIGGEADDAGREPTAYRVRRLADAAVLNGTFRPDDVRREPPRRRW